MNKTLAAIAISFGLLAMPSLAYADSCADQATAKKLAGAAKTSFMKKCSTDAQAACDTQAADKKLAGAAKTAFVGKCVKDSTGM